MTQRTGFIATWLLAIGCASPATAAVDYGNAPFPYPTLLVNEGARHTISGLYLGSRVDGELDGVSGGNASDNDGVVFVTTLYAGQPTQVNVTVTGGSGYLNAWIDFDKNGDWNGGGEHVFTDQILQPGVNTVFIPVPAGAATSGETWARFRLAPSPGSLFYNGSVDGGEVEDYSVALVPEPVNVALAGLGVLGLVVRFLKVRARR